MSIGTLNSEIFASALSKLSSKDKDLKYVIDTFGPPPMWAREPGFATLVYIVLEQQVSLASAKAAFSKLLQAEPNLNPENFIKLTDTQLKIVGFSRQKIGYCRNIAYACLNRSLKIEDLGQMTDKAARSELQKVKGIGPWTADIYLLMVLKRPDIWPTGDLALISAIQSLKNLPSRPDVEKFKVLGEPWRPWRAVAARILWHYYLSIS
jgi:DNA-3-methyladenine glycosylase II